MKDVDVWEGKSLTNLLEDIHNSSMARRKAIWDMISEMRGMITTAAEVTVLAPIIKDYFDVLVRSDDQIGKVATIVQRAISAEAVNGPSDGQFLTEEEMLKIQGDVVGEYKALDLTALPPIPTLPPEEDFVSGSVA